MGTVSEDGNPFGDFYTMLRKQLSKMKRELAAGDACVVVARIDAIDAMVEVIQGDDWANEKREAEFVEEMRNGSTPMLRRRLMVEGASWVWRVESTRCPVRAALMPISAVS